MRMIKLTLATGRLNDLEQEETSPVFVNVESIREFYPRHEGRPGTRITYNGSAGIAVTESFDEVAAMVMPQ